MEHRGMLQSKHDRARARRTARTTPCTEVADLRPLGGGRHSLSTDLEHTQTNERIGIPDTIDGQLRSTSGSKERISFLAILLVDVPCRLAGVRLVQLLCPYQ